MDPENIAENVGRWLVGKRLATEETHALKILEAALTYASKQEAKKSCEYLEALDELGVPGFNRPYDFTNNQKRKAYFTWVDALLYACRNEWSRQKFDEIIIPILSRTGYTWRREVDVLDEIDFKKIGKREGHI